MRRGLAGLAVVLAAALAVPACLRHDGRSWRVTGEDRHWVT